MTGQEALNKILANTEQKHALLRTGAISPLTFRDQEISAFYLNYFKNLDPRLSKRERKKQAFEATLKKYGKSESTIYRALRLLK